MSPLGLCCLSWVITDSVHKAHGAAWEFLKTAFLLVPTWRLRPEHLGVLLGLQGPRESFVATVVLVSWGAAGGSTEPESRCTQIPNLLGMCGHFQAWQKGGAGAQ